ncbi:hypothetical protein C8R44DRAFT_864569 [Mycena epipterygia]|nr:hypothetical protein C8R44DRAFT_864569 [Mycena epipterygia]
MTNLTEPPSNRPAARESAPRTNTSTPTPVNVHNHITTQSAPNVDLTPVWRALNAFMLAKRQCAYPQLVVTCRGQKRVFSRKSLEEMGHKRAAKLFVERFAEPEDYVETPPGTGWIPYRAGKLPPEVHYFATFCRTDEAEQTPRVLDVNGWVDNIGNVREMEVVLTRKDVP